MIDWKVVCKFWSMVALVALSGCGGGGPTVEYNENVSGTLTVAGVPVPNAQVKFMPQFDFDGPPAPTSSATTDESGKFQLRCDNSRKGAVIAKHKVVIKQGRGKDGSKQDAGPSVAVPIAYTAVTKTPLEIEVVKDKSVYDLNLPADAQ